MEPSAGGIPSNLLVLAAITVLALLIGVAVARLNSHRSRIRAHVAPRAVPPHDSGCAPNTETIQRENTVIVDTKSPVVHRNEASMTTRQGGPNQILSRAFAASSALAVGAVAVTGIFIDKIVSSSAATTPTGTSTSSTNNGGLGTTSGGTGGGQLTVPQQNQPPAGGSHGS